MNKMVRRFGGLLLPLILAACGASESATRAAPQSLYPGETMEIRALVEQYADYYDVPIALLYGSQEKEQGLVTIKDMTVGREKATAVGDRKEWLAARPGQVTAKREELVATVTRMLSELA